MSESEKTKMPSVNEDIDWKAVLDYAVYGCNELEAGGAVPDFEHLLTVNVLEAIYGPYVWAWLLAKQGELVDTKTKEFLEKQKVAMPHPARIYRTLDEFLSDVIGSGYSKAHKHYRFWVRKWNAWKTKHPGLPYRIKCAICSGKSAKLDRKHGQWKDKQPHRGEIWD
jgi:hypothetical protein